MKIEQLKNLTSSRNHNLIFNLVWSIIILFCTFIIGGIIYLTDGMISSLIHLFYIPILLAVFIFGTKGGMLFSIISGLTVGPFMPLNGLTQPIGAWILRIFMFAAIVLVVGFLVEHIKSVNDVERKKAYEDINTGYPNVNKFKHDINQIINSRNQNNFSIIIFKLENLEMINRYVDFETGQYTFSALMDKVVDFFPTGSIYSIDTSKFVIVMPDTNSNKAYSLAKEFSAKTKTPIYTNNLPISIIIKGGIVSFPPYSDSVKDILYKLDRALEQANITQREIIIYDNNLAIESEKYYNTLVTLYDALQNDEFTLVYQPKINMINQIEGVEALLRWNDNSKNNLSIAQLINIAEEAGFINEVTKWVIKHAIYQLNIWKEKGIETNVSINLSSRDLNDDSILKFTKKYIKLYDLEPSCLEFELTERTIIEDEQNVFSKINEIKDYGIKVSLDDYGTGYNTYKYLINYSKTFNYIKIDKSFINNIKYEKNRIIVEGIIDLVHKLGLEVIAEGVETKEQVNILNSINCDIMQGYYFSRPIKPEELVSKYFVKVNR